MSWLKRRWWIVATVVGVVGAAVVLLLFVFPSGTDTAGAAMTAHVEDQADDGTARVLVSQPWGDGQLVLTRYESGGEVRLGLGFVVEQVRGWRVASYTEQPASPDDVAVGSLLVARAPGGRGQPEWSAAVGELSDGRITRVEIEWAAGERASADRTNDAYMVVVKGNAEPQVARYLTEDDTEIARVPVSGE